MTPNGAPIDPAEMRKWAAGVDKSLKDLQARLLPPRQKCDEFSAELGALHDEIENDAKECDVAESHLLELYDAKPALKDGLGAIKADLSLAINEEMLDGKKRYTNDENRAAALKIALSKDPQYQDALKKLRELEKKERSYKALIESYGKSISRKQSRAWSLRSRLENLTARMAYR